MPWLPTQIVRTGEVERERKKRESKIRKESDSERREDSPRGSSRVYEGNCGKTCFADISLSTSRR